jgi:hypothetical protein
LQKKKKREFIEKLVGKAEWEDELSEIQRYALHFLQHIDPTIDDSLIISQHKVFHFFFESFIYSVIHQ